MSVVLPPGYGKVKPSARACTVSSPAPSAVPRSASKQGGGGCGTRPVKRMIRPRSANTLVAVVVYGSRAKQLPVVHPRSPRQKSRKFEFDAVLELTHSTSRFAPAGWVYSVVKGIVNSQLLTPPAPALAGKLNGPENTVVTGPEELPAKFAVRLV